MSPVPPDVSLQSVVHPPAADRTDVELLEAIADGCDLAFEELRSRYRRVVDRTCRMLLRTEPEDCAQEAFIRIWQKARLFDPQRGSAAAWLLTVTRNVAHNLGAKRVPEPIAAVEEDGGDDPEPSDRFWVDNALAHLAPREREVIELAYFDDLSQTQIARRLDVPIGTVKSWTRRGLNKLALLLDEGTA